jgi:Zn2+/Cd2+-exporting ATPase
MSSLMSMVPARVVLADTGEVVSVRDVGGPLSLSGPEGRGSRHVDGVVVDGHSEVDKSSLTGEAASPSPCPNGRRRRSGPAP